MKIISQTFIRTAIISLMMFSVFTVVYAQNEYTVLAPLPGTTNCDVGPGCDQTSLQKYLPAIFNLSIGIAAAMAFVAITWGGILYATSDAIMGKEQGKEWITNAVWGLLLVIGAWAILNTINPNILEFNLSLERPSIKTGAPNISVGTGVCLNCLSLTASNIPVKPGAGTTVAGSLQPRLIELNARLGGGGWQVTEAYPPTRAHQNSCHGTGTCVDANVLVSNPSNINAFARAARQSGLTPVYEVKTQSEKDTLIASGVTATIDVEPSITAPHFSLY